MNSTATQLNTAPADLDQWFDQRFEEKMAEREASHTPSMTIIATKGTLDQAYPPFILSSQQPPLAGMFRSSLPSTASIC
jgi:hypothetical protein